MKDKPVILVVDDQLQNIELLEAHLVTQGYEIIPAESGEEALEKLSGNHVDLVLLDVKMPGMSGFEVLEKLRADKKTGRIPVIMITAHKESEDRVKALKSGCDDFIFKPFDKHELLARVKSLLRIKFLNDEEDDSREFAESVINTVREPLISLDQDLRVVTVSRSFYEFFKVKPEETVGQLIYDLGNKQWDIPKLRELLETILPQKTTFDNYEVEHDFAGIGRRIMLLNARQIKRGMGKDRIILLAMEDITERKQLEAEIQDAREYAENIVETVREPLVVLNADLKILTANHSFYDTFKVTPEETIGNFIYDLGNRQWDIPKLRVLFEEILPHDTVFNGYEVEHDFPGIGRKIILLNARQIFRKNIGSHIILLAMEDITERKLVEERISEVMRQQQAILDNIPNSAWLKDRKGTYVAVNDPFGKAIGKEPKDVVGKNVYDIYPRELAVKYEKDSREAMATGMRTYFEESRRRSGREDAAHGEDRNAHL